jgi:hypothetical protein
VLRGSANEGSGNQTLTKQKVGTSILLDRNTIR